MESDRNIFLKGKSDLSSIIERYQDLVKLTDYCGFSLLHWAVFNEDIELCRQVIAYGGKIDQKDNAGNTPLILAAMKGATEIVKLLLKHGADSTLSNTYGADALSLACGNDNIEVVIILNDYPRKNVADDSQWAQQPFLIAISCNSKKCAEFLYEQDPSCINKTNLRSGMTGLMLAEAGGFPQMIEWLVCKGAERNPEVKTFNFNDSSPLLTPIQNISFLFPPSPQQAIYLSPNSPVNSNVFIFPSTNLPTGSQLNVSAVGSATYLTVPSFDYNFHGEHPLTPNLCFSPTIGVLKWEDSRV